jgi:hypothetical protein
MHIQAIVVNHGTTRYAELLLASLLVHHPNRSDLDILVLDNASPDVHLLDWARDYGVEITPSGYPAESPINTHGEILRDAALARPDCDAHLFLDADVCFVADNTIPTMAAELSADPVLFAVQATWSITGEDTFEIPPRWREYDMYVRDAFKFNANDEWPPLREYVVRVTDRIWPFCTLVRNDGVFRRIVELIGLSGAHNQALRGGRQWDTFGLLDAVMQTHGRRWQRSTRRVIHFGNVSYQDDVANGKAGRRDELLTNYRARLVPQK